MTDYAAEQAEEIEALSAILMDEFSPLEGPLPAGWPADSEAYRVLVTPTSGLDAGEAALVICTSAGIAGSFAGAALSKRMPQALLRRVFAVFLFVVAAYIVMQNWQRFA